MTINRRDSGTNEQQYEQVNKNQARAEAAMLNLIETGRPPTAWDLLCIARTERDTDSGDDDGRNALTSLWAALRARRRDVARELRVEVNRVALEQRVYGDHPEGLLPAAMAPPPPPPPGAISEASDVSGWPDWTIDQYAIVLRVAEEIGMRQGHDEAAIPAIADLQAWLAQKPDLGRDATLSITRDVLLEIVAALGEEIKARYAASLAEQAAAKGAASADEHADVLDTFAYDVNREEIRALSNPELANKALDLRRWAATSSSEAALRNLLVLAAEHEVELLQRGMPPAETPPPPPPPAPRAS